MQVEHALNHALRPDKMSMFINKYYFLNSTTNNNIVPNHKINVVNMSIDHQLEVVVVALV